MVTSQGVYLGVLALVAGERFVELAISRRNARRAFAAGGYEVGRTHYRFMAALHTVFFIACGAEVLVLDRPFPGAFGAVALAICAVAQGIRYWAIATLGERWNVRIIVWPNAPPITRGPYRFLRHPNYVAVALEILFLPLVHGAFVTAAIFSALNAVVLAVRIREEEIALGPGYADAFRERPRFVPRLFRG